MWRRLRRRATMCQALMSYHQTVKLTTGRHDSPADGMCVMELSSLLAGERFSDQPSAVDPVIAALLRIVNDVMDADERRRLIPYASRVIGTAGGLRARRARARGRPPPPPPPPPPLRPLRRAPARAAPRAVGRPGGVQGAAPRRRRRRA